MKHFVFWLLSGIGFLLPLQKTQACTSFLAGKNATVDGSTIITYAADSHTLYG